LLEEGQICPADILILDTSLFDSKEAFCYIETSKLNGKISYTKKKASLLTKSLKKN